VFDTDETFEAAHYDYKNKLGGPGSEWGLRAKRHSHAVYIVQLKDCDSACHRAVRRHLGASGYWRRDREVVQAAGTPAMLHALSVGPLSGHVVDYYPIHPKLKFDSVTSTSAGSCATNKANKEMKFVISIMALPEAALQMLISNIAITLPVTLSTDPVHPDKVNAISAKVACKDAVYVMEELSSFSEVEWVDELGEVVLSNRWGKGLCQSGDPDDYSIHDANLTGVGQIIGISDSGLDMKSCYFHDDNVPAPYNKTNYNHRKVIYYDTYIDDTDDKILGHGTHVCGSAAGYSTQDYGSFAMYNGNAPGAKISFFDIGDANNNVYLPVDLDLNLFEKLYVTGARVFTNSWGEEVIDRNGNYAPSKNQYTPFARKVDTFMLRHPDALVFFSAGNYGDYGGKTVTSPSTNKNGISVGASLNDNDAWKSYIGEDNAKSVYNSNGVAYFSGVGPTGDLRLKPDILAPGYPVYSAKASSSHTAECAIQPLQGTSMASPTAAGVATLVREYFMTGFYPAGVRTPLDGFNPSGALLKAVLVGSGIPMTRTVVYDGSSTTLPSYPSNNEGYGRITIGNVLNFAVEAEKEFLSLFVRGGATPTDKYYVSFQNEGEEHTYIFKTGPAAAQHAIRITVVFNDVLPAEGATVANINTLSLVATNLNSSTSYYPLSAGGTTVSTNVLVIDIASPAANSTFSVVVTATSVLDDEQPYAIVMSGEVTSSSALFNATSGVSFVHESIGLTRSVLTSIFIMIALCVLLFIALCSIHRENVFADKKKTREKKRQSSQYKGV
jgi:hypothetical protein